MPIGAAGFIVTTAQLAKLGELAAADKVDGFWELLHQEARRIEPEFPHTGYVLAVLIEYLEEQDIHVVSAGPGPDAERISEAALGMEFCITRAEAGELVGLLGGLHPAEGEFLNFYEEFAEEPLARAGAAMLDGLEYLKRACGFLATDDERLLLFVG